MYTFRDGFVDLHGKLFPRRSETVGFHTHNVAYAASYWKKNGTPKHKIIIGIPSYARGWTLEDSSQAAIGIRSARPSRESRTSQMGGTAAYWEICDYLKNGGNETVDTESVGAYMVREDQWYSYDNPETIKIKIAWLKDQGYGGAFIWSLDTDDFKGDSCGKGRYPLLSAIKEGLESYNPLISKSTVSIDKTRKTEIDKECLAFPYGRLPDPNHCQQYLECRNGFVYSMSCPLGSFYNHAIRYCDQISKGTGEAMKPVPGEKCLALRYGRFPDPNQCQQYLECRNSFLYTMSCPIGSFYNHDITDCDQILKEIDEAANHTDGGTTRAQQQLLQVSARTQRDIFGSE